MKKNSSLRSDQTCFNTYIIYFHTTSFYESNKEHWFTRKSVLEKMYATSIDLYNKTQRDGGNRDKEMERGGGMEHRIKLLLAVYLPHIYP